MSVSGSGCPSLCVYTVCACVNVWSVRCSTARKGVADAGASVGGATARGREGAREKGERQPDWDWDVTRGRRVQTTTLLLLLLLLRLLLLLLLPLLRYPHSHPHPRPCPRPRPGADSVHCGARAAERAVAPPPPRDARATLDPQPSTLLLLHPRPSTLVPRPKPSPQHGAEAWSRLRLATGTGSRNRTHPYASYPSASSFLCNSVCFSVSSENGTHYSPRKHHSVLVPCLGTAVLSTQCLLISRLRTAQHGARQYTVVPSTARKRPRRQKSPRSLPPNTSTASMADRSVVADHAAAQDAISEATRP